MNGKFSCGPKDFDEVAIDYDELLNRGLSVSGENSNYFARGRLLWLAKCLRTLHASPHAILDFGCGIGSGVPLLFDVLGAERVVGIDTSMKCLMSAKKSHASARAHFCLADEYLPAGQMDLVFCNGVFHHIPPIERFAAIDYIYRSLGRGGLFSLWENNPWNPGTKYIMRRIPFDRNASPLTFYEAQRMVRAVGFHVVRVDFLFVFPRILSFLRWMEPLISRLPLGAQYQVLCFKP